jgi:hypothetical protein
MRDFLGAELKIFPPFRRRQNRAFAACLGILLMLTSPRYSPAKSLQTRAASRGRARVTQEIIREMFSREVLRGEKAMEFDGAAERV